MTKGVETAFTAPENSAGGPARGLLAATPYELKAIRAAAPKGGRSAPPLFGGLTNLTLWPENFLAGPVLGGPMAVMALESLVRQGAREILFLGLAGALDTSFALGDLFIPTSGLSTEGTSAHYPAPLEAHPELVDKLRSSDAKIRSGPVWSTDAIFRETDILVAEQKNKGALAVEMECCSLMAAANFRGVKFAALLIISDILDGPEHITGFHKPAFKKGLAEAARHAWNFFT